MVIEMDHPKAGRFRTLGVPYSFSHTPATPQGPPPLLGADTDEVLDGLGIPKTAVNAMRADGVV